MTRSLRGGVSGILSRSFQHAFQERNIISDAQENISDVKEAFSSWDNCMQAVYCKYEDPFSFAGVVANALTRPNRWPVIALIIIAALMLISIIWCIARCVCCGLSCCCECCYCLKCCGSCCGCCDPPKGRRRKYLDESYKNLPPDQGYQANDPMSTGALPFASRPDPTTRPSTANNPPQYAQFATFDVSKKDGDEDSLPAMPTWGEAESKKVETEVVELQDLKKTETNNGQAVPLMNGISPAATPAARTPVNGGPSPFGPPGSQPAMGGYIGGAPGANAYGNRNVPGQGYNQGQNMYGQSTTTLATEQSWGVTGGGHAHNGYTEEPASMHGYDDKAGYNQYGGNDAMSMGMNQPYGMGGAARSMTGGSNPSLRGTPNRSMTGGSNASMGPPPSYPDRAHGSPAPPQGQFASDRHFDPRIAPQRTYSPAPQQQGHFPNGPPRNFSPAPPQRSFSPAPQRSFSPGPQGSQRTYSPAPQPRQRPSPPQQQRQWSGDAAPGRGPPPGGRGPPYRQYTNDSAPAASSPQRQYSSDSYRSPRPMGGGPRPPPQQRQYTADVPPGPRSPNFSRPVRSNTLNDNSYDASGGGQPQEPAAYPGKW